MSRVREIRTTRTPSVLVDFYFDNKNDYACGKCARPNLYLHTANMNVVMRAINEAVSELPEHYIWYIADIDYDEAMFEYYIEVTVFDPLTTLAKEV